MFQLDAKAILGTPFHHKSTTLAVNLPSRHYYYFIAGDLLWNLIWLFGGLKDELYTKLKINVLISSQV